jgi:ribA/ribD-fused uncharacterized protein
MSELLIQKHYSVDDNSIKGFFREHRFLSNFHLCDIEYEGFIYTSTEAAFQASKSIILEERERFTAYSPGTAKGEGRKLILRVDWERVKLGIMRDLLMIKFTQYEDLKQQLLATGFKSLIEENWWGDQYWGTVNGKGHNYLGTILMYVRSIVQGMEVEKLLTPTDKMVEDQHQIPDTFLKS